MSDGIPVRLSALLAGRARSAAQVQDRSLTEQVEHWARLGQAVEDAVLATTVQRLKARGYDAALTDRLALAMTAEGRATAAQLIRERDPVRHEVASGGRPRARTAAKPR